MKFSIEKIAQITEGELITNKENPCFSELYNLSTDTRTISTEDIFLPLSGENFNGHNFIEKALQKGSQGFLTEKKHVQNAQKHLESASFMIVVEDILTAYLKIANYARKTINPKVIAITGSSGKTTTKEIIYSILSEQYKTHKSKLNHNNEIGLCQTLLSMPETTQCLVLEMGMRGLGEIEILSRYAEPDIAVITNIGSSHIGRLGSIENIAKAKCEITEYLSNKGTLVALDDELIKSYCNWQGSTVFYGKDFQIIQEKEDYQEFSFKNNIYTLLTSGKYNVLNSISGIEVAQLLNIDIEKIKSGLKKYQPIGERNKIITINDNLKIISDCYNANPDSMEASINSTLSLYGKTDITLILGNMEELGTHEKYFHKKIGAFLSDKNFAELITIGEKAKLIAENTKNKSVIINSFLNNEEVINYLSKNKKKNSTILLKASRAMKLEEIIEGLQKRNNKDQKL